MDFVRMNPETVFKAPGFTQLIRAGNTLYISGQVARDVNMQMVGVGDAKAQAQQVFQNLEACLVAAGAGLANVVKLTIFITDARYKPDVLAVRNERFAGILPTSTTVICSGLALPEYLVEVEAIAVLPE